LRLGVCTALSPTIPKIEGLPLYYDMPTTPYLDHINGGDVIKKTGAATDYNNRPLYLLRGKILEEII